MQPQDTSPYPTAIGAEESVRRAAERILLSSGASLIDVLGRAAGEDGLALGFAFRDIVLDQDMPPASWPLTDVLDVLASDRARYSRAASLTALLSGLLQQVDGLEDEAWEDAREYDAEADAPPVRRAA